MSVPCTPRKHLHYHLFLMQVRVCWSVHHTVVSPVTLQRCVGLFSDHAEPSTVHHRATRPRAEVPCRLKINYRIILLHRYILKEIQFIFIAQDFETLEIRV